MSKMTPVKQSAVAVRKDRFGLALAWLLALSVCLAAIIAWGRYYAWHVWPINTYQLFPVLGLLAFSLMWTHYMMGTLSQLLKLRADALASYFRLTGYAVLILICLHPGILIYQRFRDGFGLPPLSYERYVAPGLGWVTILGTASLLVFLAFEFHRVYGKRRWWHYVVDASDAAMLVIVYHALRLGMQLQHGWYRVVWFLYAVTLAAALVYKYAKRYQQHLDGTPK
jgi:hypothetical protein